VKTLKLKHPIEVASGPAIDELKFADLRVGHIRPLSTVRDLTVGDYLDVIANLTSTPIAVIDKMHVSDYKSARELVDSFFQT
jgi:tail assembly chaperone E/41/14-like protein